MTDLVDKWIARAIFLSLWALYACIGPGMSAINVNTISRIGLVFSIVERHALDIDPIAAYTIDKAEFAGHTYLDKAPGLSFMAVPAVAIEDFVAHRIGMPTAPLHGDSFSLFYFVSVWVGVIFTSSLLTAAAAAALYVLARRLGASRGASLFGALAYALCTPGFGWATTFFGHGVAGACLFLGFALMVCATPANDAAQHRLGVALLAGAFLSWSVVVEFTSVPAALIIAAVGCWRLQQLPSGRGLRLLAAAMCGSAVAALPLAAYNLLAFGSVTHLGYSDVVGFDGMRTGLFGISLPRADVAVALLVGPRRGILWIAPLLVMVPFAWIAALRRFGAPLAAVLVAIPLVYLLINSGYAYWDGGQSTGPRHITPMLPFIGLALAAFWDFAARRLRACLLGMAIISSATSLMCATTMMTCPWVYDGKWVENELFQFVLPAFLGQAHHLLAPVGGGSPVSLMILLVPALLGVASSGAMKAVVMRLTPGTRSAEASA